jgi:hypothetical protein
MTSLISEKAQVPANKLYTNLTSAISSVYLANGTTLAPWLSDFPSASNAGALVVRDMGKTVYLPDPTVGASVGSQSTILRKVQLVPSGAAGYYGTGGAAGTSSEYYTGYIRIGGQTYGGGDGVQTFVRLN